MLEQFLRRKGELTSNMSIARFRIGGYWPSRDSSRNAWNQWYDCNKQQKTFHEKKTETAVSTKRYVHWETQNTSKKRQPKEYQGLRVRQNVILEQLQQSLVLTTLDQTRDQQLEQVVLKWTYTESNKRNQEKVHSNLYCLANSPPPPPSPRFWSNRKGWSAATLHWIWIF